MLLMPCKTVREWDPTSVIEVQPLAILTLNLTWRSWKSKNTRILNWSVLAYCIRVVEHMWPPRCRGKGGWSYCQGIAGGISWKPSLQQRVLELRQGKKFKSYVSYASIHCRLFQLPQSPSWLRMLQDTQVKAIHVVTPTEEIQNDVNPETLANDNADNGSESEGEVLLKLCFRDFYKAC